RLGVGVPRGERRVVDRRGPAVEEAEAWACVRAGVDPRRHVLLGEPDPALAEAALVAHDRAGVVGELDRRGRRGRGAVRHPRGDVVVDRALVYVLLLAGPRWQLVRLPRAWGAALRAGDS